MQIHDDLAGVGKGQRDHGADTLVVDIGVGLVIEPVAARLNSLKKSLGLVEKLRIGHYNLWMFHRLQILISWIALGVVVAALGGCGQKGALYLPSTATAVPARPSASAPQRPGARPTTTGEAARPAASAPP